MAAVQPIPADRPRVSPYLCIDGASEAIEFYKSVLGATERGRIAMPGGKVGHAELQVGDSVIMLSDEVPDMGNRSPRTLGGTPVTLGVYVEDVDTVFAHAIESGATALRPVQDQFYGDRSGMFEDPFGHRWSVSTHIEDVSEEEIGRHAAAFMAATGTGDGDVDGGA